jgi:hypothetical protein
MVNTYKVWSNFEIANMEFWRGEAYMKFFEYLDSKGGFYYEVSPIIAHPFRIHRWVDSHDIFCFYSAGAMRPSIQLPPQSSLLVIKSIFSTRSDTNMLPIHIVPKKGIIGYEVDVHVTQRTTLVRNPFLLIFVANHGIRNSDFDGVSCLNKYVKFIHT